MIVEILQWLQHRKGQGFTTRYMTNKNTSLVLGEANTDSLFGFDIWPAFRIPGSQGLYAVGGVGIEKLSLHVRYEAGPIVNHALHKLGASIALAYASVALAQLHTTNFSQKGEMQSEFCGSTVLASR